MVHCDLVKDRLTGLQDGALWLIQDRLTGLQDGAL